VRVTNERRWGKMTAHQMVCHLADSFRGVMGEKALSGTAGPLGGLMRWGALYVPMNGPTATGRCRRSIRKLTGRRRRNSMVM
jgi:hypothetical protein